MPSTSRTPSQGEKEAMTMHTGHHAAIDALTPPGIGWRDASGGTTPTSETQTQAQALLSVDGLRKRFSVRTGLYSKAYVSAVDHVSFTVEAGAAGRCVPRDAPGQRRARAPP